MDYEKDPNSYDFEFENIDTDEEFDLDNDPILNVFMEKLSEVVENEKNSSSPKARIPNSKKLIEVTKAFKVLTKIIKKENKDAIITYKLNDWLYDDNEEYDGDNVFVSGNPCLTIKCSCISIYFTENIINGLMKNLKIIRNLDISELTSGGFEINIQFNNIYDTYLEVSEDE